MVDEEISSASEGGAAPQGEQQVTEGTEQSASQPQTPESAPVDSGESQASSKRPQARSNFNWANQRLIEKTIQKQLSSALDEKLTPLMERLTKPPAPPTPTSNIDYNDLDGSINRLIEARIQESLKGSLGKSIPALKEELLGDLATRTSRQEAKKYLVTQKDIGNDTSKHEEIQDIIVNDKLLYHSVSEYPVEVMQEAVNRWRKSRTNPNAPSKEELTTVAGGMGAVQRGGEVSPQRVKELQDKVLRSDLSAEDRDKLNREINTLLSLK